MLERTANNWFATVRAEDWPSDPTGKKQPAPTVVSVEAVVLKEATGSDHPHLQQRLITQVCETLWIPESLAEDEKAARIASAISLLQGIKPADEIESMLAIQMVATHSAAMECLRRAMIKGQILAGRDQELKHAVKLLSHLFPPDRGLG